MELKEFVVKKGEWFETEEVQKKIIKLIDEDYCKDCNGTMVIIDRNLLDKISLKAEYVDGRFERRYYFKDDSWIEVNMTSIFGEHGMVCRMQAYSPQRGRKASYSCFSSSKPNTIWVISFE